MKPRHLLIVAVVTFVVGLLVQAPAAIVYGWTLARQDDAPLRLFGVEGSVFSGSAVQVARGNQTVASELHWTLRPWTLLLGRASYRLSTTSAPVLLDGEVGVGLGGTRVSELKASGELRALAAAAGQSFVPMAGQIGLNLQQLRLHDGWPSEVEGQLRVVGLSWALAREPIALGDYQAEMRTENKDLVALISTLSGVLDVNGDVRLKPGRSYELSLQLRPRPQAPPTVVNLLRSLGAPDPQGYYRLRRNGQVPQ